MQKTVRKAISMLLTIVMVFASVPTFAAEAPAITGFEPLSQGVKNQSFWFGDENKPMTQDELSLPQTLRATLETDSTATATDLAVSWDADKTYDGGLGEYIFTADWDKADYPLAVGVTAPVITVTITRFPPEDNGGRAITGTGTSSDPYIISDAVDLQTFANNVNSGNEYDGKFIELGDDITLSGEWTPIGTLTDKFKGTFDGCNNIISGLSINTADNYAGLFGYIYKATIKNLEVRGTVTSTNNNVGGIVGYAVNDSLGAPSIIENCTNAVNVTGNNSVGGVVGYIKGTVYSARGRSTVVNCENTGNITGKVTSVGGIAGWAINTDVTGCENSGTITLINSLANADTGGIGGIIGYFQSTMTNDAACEVTIENCFNTGAVTSDGKMTIGGVVGLLEGKDATYTAAMSSCFNTGAVSDTALSNTGVGGLVGKVEKYATVAQSYNTGDVTSSAAGFVSNVGGVAGLVMGNGTVKHCYNIGNVKGADERVGGIAGAALSGGTVKNSHSLGLKVTGGAGKSNISRVIGEIASGATASNNYAREDQLYGPDGSETDVENSNMTNSPNGGGITLTQGITLAMVFSSSSGWDPSLWTVPTGAIVPGCDLPTLLSFPVSVDQEPKLPTAQAVQLYSGGDGTAGDPYQIADEDDLIELSTNVNGGMSHDNEYLVMTDDIELTNEFTPIGTATNKFKGEFDGDSYTISGLEVDFAGNNAGLFGYVDNALIANLTVAGEVSATGNGVGGIAGNAYQSEFDNIGSQVYVDGDKYVGGIVGYASGGSINECSSSGDIYGETQEVGGIVGEALNVSITFCSNSGDIEADDEATMVGGIAGFAQTNGAEDSIISECSNTGDITNGKKDIGGIVGKLNGLSASYLCYVEECSNEGDITASASAENIGGIAGNAAQYCEIKTSYNKGEIGGLDANKHIGGIAGSAKGTNTHTVLVEQCFNEGLITAAGGKYLGGIVGYALDYSLINNCYNTGNIKGADSTGGIVGSNVAESGTPGEIKSSYSAASDIYSQNGVSPKAGGITAMSAGDVTDCVSLNLVVSAVTNTFRIGQNVGGAYSSNSARADMKVGVRDLEEVPTSNIGPADTNGATIELTAVQGTDVFATSAFDPTVWTVPTGALNAAANLPMITAIDLSVQSPKLPMPATAPSITTTTLSDGTVGTAYSATLAATGTTPIEWTIQAGTSLPPGLSLSEAGVISGEPFATGSSTFTVVATNSAGSDTKSLTLTIEAAGEAATAPTITTTSLADAKANMAYGKTLVATGTTPITWSLDSGSLPAGITLSTSGVISGTPTVVGTSVFTVKATNSAGSDTQVLSIEVVETMIFSPNLPNLVEPRRDSTTKLLEVGVYGATSLQWYKDGHPISGATTASLSIDKANGDGEYYIVGTDAEGNTLKSNVCKVQWSTDAGEIVVTTLPQGGAPDLSLANPADVSDAVLTAEQKAEVRDNENIQFTIGVVIASSEPDSDISQKAADTGYTVGENFEIDVLLQRAESGVGSNTEVIANLQRPIRMRIDIAEDLQASNRVFAAIRSHGGGQQRSAAIIDVLPDLDNDATTLTIESDKFSPYALVYKAAEEDTAPPKGGGGGGGGGGSLSANAYLDKNDAVFNLNTESGNHKAITVKLTDAGNKLNRITYNNRSLSEGADYTVDGRSYTFTKDFLSALAVGVHEITFDMAKGNDPVLTITVTDTATDEAVVAPVEPITPPVTDNVAVTGMTDVSAGSWFYNAVTYVIKNGVMQGVSTTTFAPSSNLNRAMMVQILYNLEGKPAASGAPFSDVKTGDWYADAVAWASANGVVNGVGGGRFAPTQEITREQMAVMLNNYCSYKNIELPKTRESAAFSDASSIGTWAADAVDTMYRAGILNGKGGNAFDPKGNATRAEVAQMMMGFMEAAGK